MDQIAGRLTEKLSALTREQLIEVEQFVESLELAEHEHSVRKGFARLSEPAFAKIWSNPEDYISMTPCRFGDVVLVRFPFTDQVGSKQRPAVVVSGDAYNLERPDVVLMAITSQIKATSGLGEVWLAGWQEAKLLKPSAVKPVFATFEATLILRTFGSLTEPDVERLVAAIDEILG